GGRGGGGGGGWGRGGRGGGGGAVAPPRGKNILFLNTHRPPIPPAVLAERIRRLHLHCLRVDHGYAAGPVLEDLVDSALAIGDGLLGCPAEIDVAEYRPILRVHHHEALGRMTADIDAIV